MDVGPDRRVQPVLPQVEPVLPGKQGGGWFITLLLGVVGALLGGWLGSLILGRPLTEFWDLGTWLLAIGGSIIVLLIWGLITRNRTRTT